MIPIRVEIPGEPVALGRARATVIGGHARLYTPRSSAEWKGKAAWTMKAAMNGRAPLAGPVRLVVEAVFSCPKGKHLKKSIRPTEPHAHRPDLDNVAKAVADAANGVLFGDDAQVAELWARKRVGAQGEAPKVVVSVEALDE